MLTIPKIRLLMAQFTASAIGTAFSSSLHTITLGADTRPRRRLSGRGVNFFLHATTTISRERGVVPFFRISSSVYSLERLP